MGDEEDEAADGEVAAVGGGNERGRYFPPPTIKDSTIEELWRYVRRLRIWSKVATGTPANQRGLQAYYSILEAGDDQSSEYCGGPVSGGARGPQRRREYRQGSRSGDPPQERVR